MLKNAEAKRLVAQYSDMILRLCTSYLKSPADAEDVCQVVLYKALTHTPPFSSPEHEKAWIIRVSCNQCKDLLASASRRLDDANVEVETLTPAHHDRYLMPGPITQAVAQLPDEQRIAVYLHYYEGYTAPEIANLTNSTSAAVYQRLSRARASLRTTLEGTLHAKL